MNDGSEGKPARAGYDGTTERDRSCPRELAKRRIAPRRLIAPETPCGRRSHHGMTFRFHALTMTSTSCVSKSPSATTGVTRASTSPQDAPKVGPTPSSAARLHRLRRPRPLQLIVRRRLPHDCLFAWVFSMRSSASSRYFFGKTARSSSSSLMTKKSGRESTRIPPSQRRNEAPRALCIRRPSASVVTVTSSCSQAYVHSIIGLTARSSWTVDQAHAAAAPSAKAASMRLMGSRHRPTARAPTGKRSDLLSVFRWFSRMSPERSSGVARNVVTVETQPAAAASSRPPNTGRLQVVNATNRPKTSDGFIQPSVCRGRPLSSRATALSWARV